jgi:PAS domain S-box-containing protein
MKRSDGQEKKEQLASARRKPLSQGEPSSEKERIRQSGIEVVGAMPWGSHFCQFYQTKQDLLDVLVPYFKAGLESNEMCVWVTSEFLDNDDAIAAMQKAVPVFSSYLEKGQIEIFPYTDWYLEEGKFEMQRVLRMWLARHDQALALGYQGLRVSGNPFWIDNKKDWDDFTAYEAEINNVIHDYDILVLCTYSLDKCGANEIIDVVTNHQFALIKRSGKWELIENSETKKIGEALRQSEERYRSLFNGMTEGFALHEIICDDKGVPCDYRFLEINPAFERLTGLKRKDITGKTHNEVLPNDDPMWIAMYGKVALTGESAHFDNYSPALKKHYEVFAYRPAPRQFAVIFRDITDRKKREQELVRLNRTLRALSNSNQAMMHAKDESELLEQVCKIIVEDCGHAMVWIGLAEKDEGKTVRPVASAGFEAGYLETLRITWADTERGRGPTGTAIRTGKPAVCGNMLTDPRFAPWREQALKRGYASSIVLPLMTGSTAFGAINIYSKEADPLSEDEVKLLAELASDLAYGITAIRQRSAHARVEEALRESQKDLNRAQVVARTGSWRLDVHRNELTWSAENHRIFGIPAGTPMTYETFLSTVHPEDRQHVDRMWTAALRGEPYDIEHRIIVGDKVKWVRETAEIEFDKNGVLLGGFGTTQDITDRKRAEDTLRETRDYLQNLIDFANAPIIVWDLNFKITRFNHAFERLTGHRSEDVLGMPLEILFPQDSKEDSLKHIRRALSGERWEVVEIPILITDGTVRTILWNSANIYNKERTSVVATIAQGQDITERKRMEQALEAARISAEQAKDAAEAANKAKDHFLAALSHELRTPLTPVMGMVSMLQKDLRFDANTRESLEMIRRNVELEARLIDDLLDVTRIERGKIELDRQAIDLCAVIRRAAEVCTQDIKERNLKFSMDAPDGPYAVDADPVRLEQVFWNLIKNAVKFTPPGGRISIRCRRDKDSHVVAEVSDTGKGISPELLPRLFGAFEQGDRQSARQYGGLGLGLTISKGLVDMHGGTLTAHSEGEGKGATFAVRLPLLPAEAAQAATVAPLAAAHPRPSAPPRALRILLVEDHENTARMMTLLLSALGHEVHTAGDVTTAMRLAGEGRTGNFNLLISDLGLPDGSGLDLMHALRQRGLDLPAIALSGYGSEQDIHLSRKAGFAEHLVKPVDISQVESTIARIFGEAGRQD